MFGTSIFAAALACAAPPPQDTLPTIPHERFKLDNGLTVLLHKDARLPLVAVSVWYDVGALHERSGRSGFAHLFEHMMFQGSAHVGEDQYIAYLQQIGATQINGTTGFDRTNYFETVPRNELELAMWLESDRMGYLLQALNKKSLANQIEVVKNERRQSIENTPYGMMGELIVKTIYPPSHPYHGNVIGSMEDLGAATVEDVRDFFLSYYSPANATLAIAGDFEDAQVKGLIDKYFAPLRGRPKPLPPKTTPPVIEKEQVIHFDEPVASLAKLSMTWLCPSAFEPHTAELDLLAYVLSGTKSSRLDKRLTYDDQIAQSVTAHLDEQKSGSLFQIEVVVRPGRTLEEAQRAVDEVLAKVRSEPPTAEEMRRALNSQETRVIKGLELLGGFSGRTERLQTYNLYLGDSNKLEWDLMRYRNTKPQDVLQAAKTYLDARRLVVLAAPKAHESTGKGTQQ